MCAMWLAPFRAFWMYLMRRLRDWPCLITSLESGILFSFRPWGVFSFFQADFLRVAEVTRKRVVVLWKSDFACP